MAWYGYVWQGNVDIYKYRYEIIYQKTYGFSLFDDVGCLDSRLKKISYNDPNIFQRVLLEPSSGA